jgi:hypothetical protein
MWRAMVYVFCAEGEARICFSFARDPALLPRSQTGAPWQAQFVIVKDARSLSCFGIDGAATLVKLNAHGNCLAQPKSPVPLAACSRD